MRNTSDSPGASFTATAPATRGTTRTNPAASPRTAALPADDSAARQPMLDGPILATLLRLAAPNVVLVMVQAASSTVDGFYLGRLGPSVLAGAALVLPVWMLMVTMSAGGIGGGIASSVARALGGGRRADANALVAHSLVLVTLLGVVYSTVVLVAGPTLYAALGGQDEALTVAVQYSGAVFAAGVCVWLVNGFSSLLRGAGEMVVPAVVIVAGEVLHIALAPLLIFGLGPFPELGVTGAGISLGVSYALRMLALAIYVFGRRATLRLPARPLALRRGPFVDILRVGLPGSLNTVLTNLTVMAVTSLVSTAGTFALAGYGLAARLEYLQIPLVFGFGAALVTMVGTNVGAGRIQRARRIAWTGAGVAAAVTGTVGVVVALWPMLWLGLFTTEPAVLAVGALYLRIVGPTWACFGLGLALYFAAQGGGRLVWSLVAAGVRPVVTLGLGWLALTRLHAELVWVFGAIALGFVVYGAAQALVVRLAIRPLDRRA